MMNLFRIFISLFLLLNLEACSRNSEDAAKSKATIETSQNVFENKFFGVSIVKPDDWHNMSAEEQMHTKEAGSELLFSDNEDMQRAARVNAKKVHTLFSFAKHALGSPVDINPSITVLAENVSHLSGIVSGEDYFFHLKKALTSSGVNYELSDTYGRSQIGGYEFVQLDTKLVFNENGILQSYYAKRRGDFMYLVIETYGDLPNKPATSSVLDSIKFDW